MPQTLFTLGAFAIIFDNHQRVLLSHRRDMDAWNLPGGGVESGETPVEAVIREVTEETGLEVNPHLFRHVAAKLHLEANPGEYEIVRRLLGHTDIKTTTSFYTGTEGAAAARHYDRTILGLRDRTATML